METGPPTRSQPQSTSDDGWRKVTLTVPNDKVNSDGDLGEAPVAPPRFKRPSAIDRQPCGFKELFGNNVSRRSSCDSILKGDPLTERERELLQHKRKSKSISDFNLNEIKPVDSLSISTIRIPVTRTLSLMERAMVQQSTVSLPRPTLQRKVSRVGNKKSDKFFGENLSDCLSDDPITPEPELTPISFTYHTISTLITPITHTSPDGKDKFDNFIDATANNGKSKIDTNPSDATSLTPIQKPFIISERIDAKQIATAEDKKSSLDKKAEFLMAMLEGNNSYQPMEEARMMTPPRRSNLKKRNSQDINAEKKSTTVNNDESKTKLEIGKNDAQYYKGMIPVDEPLIVPRKRQTKHICDDDDQYIKKEMAHNQSFPKGNNKNETPIPLTDKDIEKYIIAQVTGSSQQPKRKTYNLTTVESIIPANLTDKKSASRVRHLSQENLMSKKILTSKSNDTIDLMRIKSMQKCNNNFDFNQLAGDRRLESVLKKYTSQQSFFTSELMSQIADRVYGFQDPFETLGSCDDGSSKCTPNSKLTTRKISAHRKESSVTRPILENEIEISSTENASNNIKMDEKPAESSTNQNNDQLTVAVANHKIKQNATENNQTILNDTKLKDHIANFLSIERECSAVCDTPNITMKHIEEIFIIPSSLVLSETSEIPCAPIIGNANNVLDDIYKNHNTILGNFQQNLNVNAMEKSCDNLENLISSDDETDSDITVKKVPLIESTENKQLQQLRGNDVKRGSIVEVDAWFLKHNELSNLSNIARRGSESHTSYDTRKVFPFGIPDPGAGTKFFETKPLSKSAENIQNHNSPKVMLTANQNENSNDSSPTDHSILLKYLK